MCPTLLPLFLSLWGGGADGQPTCWARTQNGETAIRIADGLLQGSCEAPEAFALDLQEAIEEFRRRISELPHLQSEKILLWAYVDDITLAVREGIAPEVMHIL